MFFCIKKPLRSFLSSDFSNAVLRSSHTTEPHRFPAVSLRTRLLLSPYVREPPRRCRDVTWRWLQQQQTVRCGDDPLEASRSWRHCDQHNRVSKVRGVGVKVTYPTWHPTWRRGGWSRDHSGNERTDIVVAHHGTERRRSGAVCHRMLSVEE